MGLQAPDSSLRAHFVPENHPGFGWCSSRKRGIPASADPARSFGPGSGLGFLATELASFKNMSVAGRWNLLLLCLPGR